LHHIQACELLHITTGNMTDDMIKALAKNGGVIQICLLDVYIKDPDTTTVRYQKEKELNHIYETRYESMTDDEKKKLREEWRSMRDNYPERFANRGRLC
jgi:membrane dipeptidase